MYHSTGKPSVAKFRARLEVIRKASASGHELAKRWNPTGRYYQMRRELISLFIANEEVARDWVSYIDAGRRRR